MRFLRDGTPEVLGDTWRAAMQQPKVSTKEVLDMVSYGYGLYLADGFFLGDEYSYVRGDAFYGTLVVEHRGWTVDPNYTTGFYYFPELDFGFLWMLSGGSGSTLASLWASLQVALETIPELPVPSTPPDLTVDPASFGAYVGEYFDPYVMGTIIVTQVGDELQISVPDAVEPWIGCDPVLAPVTPDNFEIVIGEWRAPVTFIFDGQPTATYFRSRWFVGTRVGGQGGAAANAVADPSLKTSQTAPGRLRPRPIYRPAEFVRRMREHPGDVGPLQRPLRHARRHGAL